MANRYHPFVLILTIPLLVALMGLSCSLPGNQAAPAKPAAPAAAPTITPTPAAPFLPPIPPVRDEAKIIILSVTPDKDSNVAEVSFALPKHLAGCEIYADTVKVDAAAGQNNSARVDLKGKVASKNVSFIFKTGGKQAAACTVKTSDLLRPEGDCTW